MESYSNITINSVAVNENNIAWLIELTGISYVTTYTFTGIYANNINLGKIDKAFTFV